MVTTTTTTTTTTIIIIIIIIIHIYKTPKPDSPVLEVLYNSIIFDPVLEALYNSIIFDSDLSQSNTHLISKGNIQDVLPLYRLTKRF